MNSLVVDGVYENGVLKLDGPLPLGERERVQITIHTAVSHVRATAGLIPCADAELIERIAEGPEYSILESP